MTRIGLAVVLLVSLAARAGAEIKPAPFDAVCHAVETHAYRSDSTLGAEWSTGEKFLGDPWKFRYRGDDYVLIDDRKVPIVARLEDIIIIAADAGEALFGAGIWSYAINLKLGAIVASQVNGHDDVFSTGVKTRSVEFNCNFGAELF